MDQWDSPNWTITQAGMRQEDQQERPADQAPTAREGSINPQKRDIAAVVACIQCRSRKVRCDAGQPKCNNCTKRSEDCEYVLRKIRGPDRQPGRVRMFWKKPEGDVASPLMNRQKSKRLKNKAKNSKLGEMDTEVPDSVRKSACMATAGGVWSNSFPSSNSMSAATFVTSTSNSIAPVETTDMALYQSSLPNSNISTHFDGLAFIPRGPSALFTKQTWWDTLVQTYCKDSSQSPQKIFQDITFLFNQSVYWCSFIYLPSFFEKLHDPNQRTTIQPSVVLATLALTILMKSYENNLGEKGRQKAMALRDAAQSALEASISVGWIDIGLAQAALLLTLFEGSAHQCHAPARASSAILLLDSLIRALGLLLTDIHEPDVSMFPADEIPTILSSPMDPNQLLTPLSLFQAFGDGEALYGGNKLQESYSVLPSSDGGPSNPSGSTASIGTSNSNASIQSNDPDEWNGWNIMMKQPPWPPRHITTEVEKEEARRLCWNALMVVSIFQHVPYLQQQDLDLHIGRQENYAIFFPVESKYHTRDESHSAKDTIWALHCRSILLWDSCRRIRQRSDWESRKAELSSRAWMEAAAIETSLARHTLCTAKSVFYLAGDFIFQIKAMISSGFTRSIPIPHTLTFDRDSSEEWLSHRAQMSAIVQKTFHIIATSDGTGAGGVALELAKRPLTIWWAFYQVHSGIACWKLDPSLTYALEQSWDFLALAEFVVGMWPSPSQEKYLAHLKSELVQACQVAGIAVPGTVPIPGLRPNAKVTLTSLRSKSCSTSAVSSSPNSRSADIPILPVD